MKKENLKTPEKKRVRPIIIITVVFLSLVLIAGLVLGAVAIVKDARAVAKYKGVKIDLGVANYLAATFKSDYIAILNDRGIDAYDDPFFWNGEAIEGVTYADMLEEETVSYIKSVIVGAYLFDRVSSLSSAEKGAVKNSCRDFLDLNFSSDEDRFNAEAESMNFDYDDMCDATTLIYKASLATEAIYGKDGNTLKESGSTADLEYVLSQYTHVGILIIRKDTEYLINSEGNRVEVEGKDQVYELTAAEKAERQTDIERIRELIYGYENDLDEQMSPIAFENYLKKYDYGYDYTDSGYYFSSLSAYTAWFDKNEASGIVAEAFDMDIGEYREIDLDFATCFIYKYEVSQGAYLNSALSDFFTDFYSDGALYLYSRAVAELTGEVTLKDAFYDIDLVNLPYNWELVVKVSEGE